MSALHPVEPGPDFGVQFEDDPSLIEASPFHNGGTLEVIAWPDDPIPLPATSDETLRTVCASAVPMRSIEWVDKPELQGSAFTLVAGPKGVGKGTWLAKKIAKTTRGLYGDKLNVLIVSSEDSAAIDLVPRLTAAGADLDRVQIVVDAFVLPADLDKLRDLARAHGDVGLIVIDPVGNHLGGADTDKEGLIRFALAGLNQLADSLECMVIGVRHLKKNRENGALASVLGSTAWVDLPRAVLAFAPDDEDPMIFHVQVIAGNRSGRDAAQSYRIELADVGLKEPVTHAIELGESSKSVDDLLSKKPKRPSKSDTARELILDILDNEGEQESDALDARIAKETGLAAGTVGNLRLDLKNDGLIRNHPDKDETGAVLRWKVSRTLAPRSNS